MANAKVNTNVGSSVKMTLATAPSCQYLEDLRNGQVCFVHQQQGCKYVRYLSVLGPKCCHRGTFLADVPVRVMQPGESINIVIDEVGYPPADDRPDCP